MRREGDEVITLRVSKDLARAMQGVENRSQFIRDAILAALDSTCPLCQGAGVLSTHQRRHWEEFARWHSVKQCDDCHQMHLTCDRHKASGCDVTP